jgi:carbonic anhydrase
MLLETMKHPSLRAFLSAGFLVTALFVSGCKSSQGSGQSSGQASVAGALPPTKESQAAMTPQKAMAELKAGNERFASGHPLVRDPLAAVKATASGQYPFAVVLSCLDSRVPIELVCDQGIGDIFSARVAGNVLEEDVLGSMEFGCKAAGAKLIAVIGHSNCGAVKGAIDNVEMGNLTALLGRIKPAIDQVPGDTQPRDSKNLEFVDKVAEANVHLVMKQVRERSPVLREMLDQGKIELVGGMYDLSTGKIHFFEQ